MRTEKITIRVDADAALGYRTASEDRRKLDLLLSLRLDDALRPTASLQQIMQDISRQAGERGLTQEDLESILNSP